IIVIDIHVNVDIHIVIIVLLRGDLGGGLLGCPLHVDARAAGLQKRLIVKLVSAGNADEGIIVPQVIEPGTAFGALPFGSPFRFSQWSLLLTRMKFASNCHDPPRLSKVSRGFLAHWPAMPFGLAGDWQYKGRTSSPFKMRR